MEKESKTDTHTNWYELWMKQSKDFFDSANKNLSNIFTKNAKVNPEEQLKQINQWLEAMKTQWEFSQLTEEQKVYATYWKTMSKMYQDASDLLLVEWIKRTREKNPVSSVRELYEMWLRCCQEIHEKSLRTKSYQESYGEFMSTAFKFWKNYMPQ